MISFKLNGKEVQGEEGQYILQVADKYGVDIPTLCHHQALEPAGMCRLCTVELYDGRRTRFVTACNYPIWEGMEIHTNTSAVNDIRKVLVELLLARCPDVPFMKELAAKYDIKEPRFTKEGDDCILCGLCVRMCEKMGNSAINLTGRGVDMKVDTPFHIQTDVCMGCGACVSVCPTGHIKLEDITKHAYKPIPSEYDLGLKGRKPIYVPYPQAIPNTPVIDRDQCMHFKTGECKVCTFFCGVDAIDHSQQDETVELNVGSIILAPGFQPFDPSKFGNYSYANHPNVLTALEFERILSASGPTMGHLVRPGDGREPKKIAFLQCVGSRDLNTCDNGYCSSVCCMYAVKEAMLAIEHSHEPLDVVIFFMDMRTFGKDFERYYEKAKTTGVRFIRSRIHTVDPADDGGVDLAFVTEDGKRESEHFDMLVLSHGLEISPETVDLANRLEVELDHYNFAQTSSFTPVSTSRPGIYACGVFTGPKDIPISVMEASAAASAAGSGLASARGTQVREKIIPEARNITGEPPRIGVFVCRCGINIAGVVDVPQVVEYAKSLPFVEYVTENLFTCSQDTQDQMTEVIKNENLNRVVVAACTPRTHEPLFQETLINASLNKYLFEMANIRNHDSWVHSFDPEAATEKAKDLVNMAVAKAALLAPLEETTISVDPGVMVVGGGVAGMSAALALATQGFKVQLVEKSDRLGGQANNLYHTAKGEDIQAYLKDLTAKVRADGNINVHLEAELTEVEGFVGNFKTRLSNGAAFQHGAAIIATGAGELKPQEYMYGQDQRVLTSLEMDALLKKEDSGLKEAKSFVFIQCVGSREPERPYCSKVCCTHSVLSALEIKERNPEAKVFILYRDMRTFAQREDLYKEARAKGVLFVRYDLEGKPKVQANGPDLEVIVKDPILGREISLRTDYLTLAAAITSNRETELAQMFKVPMDDDGWFLEAHQKLRPVDFATDGVFMAGLAHYPKDIAESVAQAEAAASRAMTVVTSTELQVGGVVAEIDQARCTGCNVCVLVCPFKAIELDENSKAVVNPALCKGCGNCVASCRSGAPTLKGFTNAGIFAQISAYL